MQNFALLWYNNKARNNLKANNQNQIKGAIHMARKKEDTVELKDVNFDNLADYIYEQASDNSNEIEIPAFFDRPMKSGLSFVDYVLGDQGFFPTQSTILTGDPGCGKTTLTLQIADALRGHGTRVAFASCEMRKEMVSRFQKRLGAEHNIDIITDKWVDLPSGKRVNVPFASSVPHLIESANRLRAKHPDQPFMLIVDSLQELDDGYFKSGRKTSRTAYRAMDALNEWAKETECGLIVIGQVTKDGKMAGSNDIKHLIDAHLHISIETKDEDLRGARILEATKNRFAGCGQIVFMRIGQRGFSELARISDGGM